MNYVDYEDILRRKRALSDLLASGDFDPKKASTEDIRWAQRLIGTNDDGLWGTQSQAALDAYKKSYDGPVKFNWGGMEGNEAAQAYSAWDTSRIEAEEKLAANEQRIEELKQEYLVLQQEQETATEDLERNLAANRAGIGDTSQYNAWRARVEAREAQNQAREADSYASLRQLRNQVDRAYSDISWARGKKQIDEAKADYLAKVDEYNEAARKAGLPAIKAKGSATEETITEFDVAKFARKHRNSKGIWDSPENKTRFDEMAESLGTEGIKYLDEAAYQSNKPTEDAKKKKWAERKANADKLVRELVNMRMDDTQRRLFNNRWNAGTDEDIKLIKEFYNYDTKTGAFSPKG